MYVLSVYLIRVISSFPDDYVHRWSGRGMFLCVAIHGSLWIRNHIGYHRISPPYSGSTKGNVRHCRIQVRTYLYHCAFLTKTCSGLPSPDFLLWGTSCASLLRHAYLGGYGWRPDLHFVLRHDLLSHAVCPPMGLSSIGILLPRLAHAAIPLPRQGCFVDTHERHDYRTHPDYFPMSSR